MKALVLLPCVVLAASADAKGNRSLETAKLTEKPVSSDSSDANCTGASRIISSRVIANARVTLVHDCDSAAESSWMVVQIGERYVRSEAVAILFHPRDGLEPAMFKDLVSDRVYPGTVLGGGRGVVHAVITRDEHHTAANRSIDSRATMMHVQACSLAGDPGCAEVGDYACAPKGCSAPTLEKGVVRVVDGTGKVDKTTLVVEIE